MLLAVQRSFLRTSHNLQNNYLPLPMFRSVTGHPLPSARSVSQSVHTDRQLTNNSTLMLMQWGQFLDHDITIVPMLQGDKCTRCQGYNSVKCYPIPISREDSFYRQVQGVKKLCNFVDFLYNIETFLGHPIDAWFSFFLQ